MPQASTYAESLDTLDFRIYLLVAPWFFLVLGYFLYLIFRYRAKDGQKAEYITGETHKQKMAIEIPHYLILVCDVAIIVMTFIVWNQIKIDKPPLEREIRIVGQQWAWSFYHPGEDGLLDTEDDIALVDELHIEKGVVYHFHLESRDVMHSFSVPVFRLKQDAVPGRVITGWFEATKEGEWDIQCAEMCGIAHGIMGARIFIKSPEEHATWIAANTPEGTSNSMLAASEQPASETKEDANNG